MRIWDDVVGSLITGGTLSYAESYRLMNQIMAGELGDIRLASFLSLLALRGVSTDELHGMADCMRDCARPINLPQKSVDIVGTGGDQARTANISTMAAIVVAATGTPVVKHGNRASTSASGSADVLEALGVNLQLAPDQIERVFMKTSIAFLFANSFHPSMRYAAAVRKDLAFPTAFNVLGPLTNPARPQASAIGVAKAEIAPLVAGVFAKRGTDALVFRGQDHGLDEISTTEPIEVWDISGGVVTYQRFDPAAEFDMETASLKDLRGGTPQDNAQIARDVLSGRSGPIADAVILNAAAALVAAQEMSGEANTGSLVERLGAALTPAREAIASGAAMHTLDTWIEASNNESGGSR